MDRAISTLALLVLMPASGLAQVPADDPIDPVETDSAAAGRVVGWVYDRDGEGVPEAQIRVLSERGAVTDTKTDPQGRFRIGVLAPGRWEISVTAENFLPSEGFLVLSPGDRKNLEIELRGLDERTPRFAEGNPESSVRAWLEAGNALLAQGQATRARTEYEKALPHLEPLQRAEVLRTVAQTYYLEQLPGAAADALWQAVRLDPDSSEGRQLYVAVMTELGRQQAAEEHLQELDAKPVEDAPEAQPAAPVRGAAPAPLPEPESPEADRIGTFGVRFNQRNPAGLLAEVDMRYGLQDEWIEGVADYSPNTESFSVFVPETYKTDAGWGLLVWVSPTARGDLRRPENRVLLAERRLIWIGANRAGNPRALWERIGLALDAAQEMQRYFDLDPERIYVGGYSGGGRIAAALALLWPEVFRGGVCWFGTSWWGTVPVPYRPGHSWPPTFARPDRRSLKHLRKGGRLSLVTADLDFNRSQTRAVHREMLEEGIDGAAYFQIPEADHYFGVNAEWLGKALAHLDER